MIAIVLLCVFVGGTVTYAAEKSLPGDVLYPIKIYVNEPVKAATKVTPKAKVRFEEEKVIKRLTEVETLVEKGKFDGKKRIQVEKQVEKSVKAINLIKKKNATTTQDEFREELYYRIKNIKKGNDNKDEVEKFEKKIKFQLDEFDTNREVNNDNTHNDKKENHGRNKNKQ